LRLISRVIVEGARPRLVAINRHEAPAANPREISSRSANDNARDERIRGAGRIPPALRIIE
jgi:hypothetical protein